MDPPESDEGHARRDRGHHRPSSRHGLRIFVGTANLGHALPNTDSISAWLPHHGKTHHVLHANVRSSSVAEGVSREDWNRVDSHGKIEVIAVGMQESVAGSDVFTATGLTAGLTGISKKDRTSIGKAFGKVNEMVSGGHQAEIGRTKRLKEMVTGHIGEDYELMTQYQRGEMVFYLFVRNDLKSMSSVIEVRGENCGVASIMANKGGIATLLAVGSTRLAFLSAHLAAGDGASQYEGRNADIKTIFHRSGDQSVRLLAHHAFVFGDLNYRISLPPTSRGTEASKEETMYVCRRIVAQKDWAAMNKYDELQRALRNRDILVGFQTEQIRTHPTYRCERKEGFHFDEKRVPSYTDRILWKSMEETRSIEALIYEPISMFSTSDHKPVRGLFFLPNRPHLRLHPEKSKLCITIKGIRCKSLIPPSSILQGEINPYLKIFCEPTSLEHESSGKAKQTNTVKCSDRPSWPREEIELQINVSSKEEVHGAFLCMRCMTENMVSDDSVLGTIAIDLEHLIRKSLGVEGWTTCVERRFLRNGREVGTLFCDMDIDWGIRCRSTHRPREQPRPRPTPRGCASGTDETKERSKGRPSSSRGRSAKGESEKSFSHYLTKLNLPHGILSTVVRNYHSCEKRYWLIDNSLSMQTRDSHLMGDNFESTQVSRWAELCENVCFHAKMSARCNIPTIFQLINPPPISAGPQQFSVSCSKRGNTSSELEEARRIMTNANPNLKRSPLIQCISDFKAEVSHDAPHLSSNGKHVALVMCTQGLPTDQTGNSHLAALRQFKHALYSTTKLPVKIVIRLCTDDEETFKLYNAWDSKLDNCDVLDDYWGEAMEVHLHNPWLCYGLGLHRLREAGLAWGLVDDLDTRSLTLDEIHRFCNYFFLGQNKKDSTLPHPRHWKAFLHSLSQLMKKESSQWNPVKKQFTPWVNLSTLESMHHPSKSSKKKRNAHRKKEKPRASGRDERGEKGSHDQSDASANESLADADSTETAPEETLENVIREWSHQPPRYERLNSLPHLLVAMPDVLPPENHLVEPHEYFNKWNAFSDEAFRESGDELNGLLKRAMRKVKLFLHPDKLPKDCTENQSVLFRAIWDVMIESEEATMK